MLWLWRTGQLLAQSVELPVMQLILNLLDQMDRFDWITVIHSILLYHILLAVITQNVLRESTVLLV